MRREWVLAIRDQCEAAGVPFFFKQWGGVSKKRTGRRLLGKTWDDLPLALAHRSAGGSAARQGQFWR
jgi:protein gp37